MPTDIVVYPAAIPPGRYKSFGRTFRPGPWVLRPVAASGEYTLVACLNFQTVPESDLEHYSSYHARKPKPGTSSMTYGEPAEHFEFTFDALSDHFPSDYEYSSFRYDPPELGYFASTERQFVLV
jgi:hypothetical protein